MINQKEALIKEKRLIEATKKNLMGPSGKLGSILQVYGTPIIRQSSGLYDSTYISYNQDYNVEYEKTLSGQNGPSLGSNEIEYFDDNQMLEEGLFFDGLNHGIHLEIIYWTNENKLKVNYKGYLVYLEVAGELECYVPKEDWEKIIENFFDKSKMKSKNMKKQAELNARINFEEKKQNFFEKMKIKWGLNL